MRLSQRLETVASFVTGSRVADIGTDHGYIPIELVRRGKVDSAIAMDMRTGPLERADQHILEAGLEDQIQTRLSDGVSQLHPGEADSVVIAGMGGELILHILEEGHSLWEDVAQWVISPQSEIEKVRTYLTEHGFLIEREAMLCEDGKYYTVLSVIRGFMEPLNPIEARYGRYLIQEKNPVLCEFFQKEAIQISNILHRIYEEGTQTSTDRREKLEEELKQIKEAQHAMR
ncbi:MAG: class I SAM-dependent methyltransferase [Hungatella sp.]